MATNKRDPQPEETAAGGWTRILSGEGRRKGRAAGMLVLAVLVLGGGFVFHSEWTIWTGLFWGGLGLVALGWHREWWEAWRDSGVFRAVCVWLGWVLGASMLRVGWVSGEMGSPESWAWGAVGLAAWLLMLHWVGREERAAERLGVAVVGLAVWSAGYSVVWYGWVKPDWHWGMRLSNALVYGGWNQVCSGVTWAFAAVWALVLAGRPGWPRWGKAVLAVAHAGLVFVALATLSRGALLILLVGHGAWLLSFGQKAGWGMVRLVAVLTVFHLVMPGLVEESGPETEVSRRYPRVIDANPLKEWTKRADTGRFEMYAAVVRALKEGSSADLLLGFGAWATNEPWHRHLKEETPMHPHSVLAGTALQGGLLGLGGLLVVLGLGLRTAWRAGRASGWPGYGVLALAGLAGVVFDGHSLATINSVPRFEPLLAWTGLLLASGQWCGRVGTRG